MSTVTPISHPDRGPSPEDSHQRDRGGEALGEGVRGSAPSPKPPVIRCLWVVTCETCHDFRRFESQFEASEFAADHHRRYHLSRS